MTIKPIKTASDHAAALARLDAIFDATPGTREGDEAEVLATLIQLYEEKYFPIDLPSPIAAIRFRMEQQGLKAKDLIPHFGSASKVSEVLSGRRRLSLAMIRSLIAGLSIPAQVLLQDSTPAPRRSKPNLRRRTTRPSRRPTSDVCSSIGPAVCSTMRPAPELEK